MQFRLVVSISIALSYVERFLDHVKTFGASARLAQGLGKQGETLWTYEFSACCLITGQSLADLFNAFFVSTLFSQRPAPCNRGQSLIQHQTMLRGNLDGLLCPFLRHLRFAAQLMDNRREEKSVSQTMRFG